MSGTLQALKNNFKTFSSKKLIAAGGASVLDEPLDERAALLADLSDMKAADEDVSQILRALRPAVPVQHVVFPSLLSDNASLTLGRGQLETETRLLLERKQEIPLQDDTYLYSIRATSPAPFRPTSQLEQAIAQIPVPLAHQVRAGYLTHDVLYGLLSDEGRLVAVLDAFLHSVTEVEVKVRRVPLHQRAVVVTLTD